MTAYYNEFDPKAAAWLRELIRRDLIAPGDVDERSISDVRPEDLDGYTQHHFFAGIGGWSYALRLADWPDDRPCWTGSCPCQPFSAAGKGKGTDDERHLWPAFRWLIAQRKPPVVFGEQVASTAGREWITGVRADLEAMGYAVGAADLCAAGIGAPHIRQRLWWVADAENPDRRGGISTTQAGTGANGIGGRGLAGSGADGRLGDADQQGPQGRELLGSGCAGERIAGPAGHWDGATTIPCGDGKARRIEPGVAPLASRLSECLVRLRDIERAAIEEIDRHATNANTDTSEMLRRVRDRVYSPEVWQAKSPGGSGGVQPPEVLLNFLFSIEPAFQPCAEHSGIPKAGGEIHRRALRSLWIDGEPLRPPYQRRCNEQRAREHPDIVQPLSLILAQHAQAYRQAAIEAHAGSSRVVRLRGYGNAIVPQVAAEFIEACEEVVT